MKRATKKMVEAGVQRKSKEVEKRVEKSRRK